MAFWGVMAVAATTLWTGLASVPLLDPDESRFARTSVEMLRSGDLVVPRFENQPRLVKPPMVHWVQGLLFQLLGAREWTARLHSVVGTLATLLLTGWIARRRFGEEGRLWAASCLATLPLAILLGRVGTLDAFLTLHVLGAVALDIADPEGRDRYRGLVVGGLLGLGFLIKGPIAILLPLIVMLAGRTFSGRDLLPRRRSWIQGLAGWAIIALPWGLAFASRVGGQATGSTLREEVLNRILHGTSHVEPAWFYVLVLPAVCFPWWATFVVAVWRLFRERSVRPSKTARYAAAGFIAGLALLSLSRGKLPSYILPLTPFLALVCAWEIGRQLAAPDDRRGGTLMAAVLFVYAAVFAVVGWKRLDGPYLHVALTGAALYLCGGVVAAIGAYRRRPRVVHAGAAATTALFLIVIVRTVHPVLAGTNSAYGLIEAVPELRSGRPLVRVAMQLPSLTFYLDRIPEQVSLSGLQARVDRGDDAMYIFADVDLPAVPQAVRQRLRPLGSRAKLRVFEVIQPQERETEK